MGNCANKPVTKDGESPAPLPEEVAAESIEAAAGEEQTQQPSLGQLIEENDANKGESPAPSDPVKEVTEVTFVGTEETETTEKVETKKEIVPEKEVVVEAEKTVVAEGLK